MESAINVGHNLQVLGKAEETLPALINAYFAAIGKPAPDLDLNKPAPSTGNAGGRARSPKPFDAAAAQKAAQERLRARSPKPNAAAAGAQNRSRSPKKYDPEAAAKAA